jgi:hypothetical protein
MGKLVIFEGEYEPGKEPAKTIDNVATDSPLDDLGIQDELRLPVWVAEQNVARRFGLIDLPLIGEAAPELKSHIVRLFNLTTDLDKEIAAIRGKKVIKGKKVVSDAVQKRCADLERAMGWLHDAAQKLREGRVDQTVEIINEADRLFRLCAWQPGKEAREQAHEQHRQRNQSIIDSYKEIFADILHRDPTCDRDKACLHARQDVVKKKPWRPSETTSAKAVLDPTPGRQLKTIAEVLENAGLIAKKGERGWTPMWMPEA